MTSGLSAKYNESEIAQWGKFHSLYIVLRPSNAKKTYEGPKSNFSIIPGK